MRGVGMVAAEFFAGMGLMRAALNRCGIDTVFANDIDKNKASLYKENWGDGELRVCDIHKLRGCDVPNVDLATASFPCVDVSLAGYRAGLKGTRSGSVYEFCRTSASMRRHSSRKAALRVFLLGFRDIDGPPMLPPPPGPRPRPSPWRRHRKRSRVVELQHVGRWQSPTMPARYVRGQLAAESAMARLRYGRWGHRQQGTKPRWKDRKKSAKKSLHSEIKRVLGFPSTRIDGTYVDSRSFWAPLHGCKFRRVPPFTRSLAASMRLVTFQAGFAYSWPPL